MLTPGWGGGGARARNGGAMKHIIPTLTLTTLAAASAMAQTAAVKGNGLTYDRLSGGFSQNDTFQGLNGSFTALLGNAVVIGGSYSDLKGRKDFADVDGNGNAFLLGAKFSVGPGDLIVSYAYTQLQLSGVEGGLAAGLNGDTDTFGLTYRYALNSTVEFSAGVARTSGDASFGVIDAGDVIIADTLDYSDTTYSLGVRFNFTKELDLTVNYTFADENTFSASVGFSF